MLPGDAIQLRIGRELLGSSGVTFSQRRDVCNRRSAPRRLVRRGKPAYPPQVFRPQTSAAETVLRDWDDFVTFYDFPAEHWIHLWTSNPIGSLFAGVRLRTDVAKRMRRRENALYLVFKIAQRLEHSWRPLNGGLTVMTLLFGGARFVDGEYVPRSAEVSAA